MWQLLLLNKYRTTTCTKYNQEIEIKVQMCLQTFLVVNISCTQVKRCLVNWDRLLGYKGQASVGTPEFQGRGGNCRVRTQERFHQGEKNWNWALTAREDSEMWPGRSMTSWNVWNGILTLVYTAAVDIQLHMSYRKMLLNWQCNYCSLNAKMRNTNCGCKGYLLNTRSMAEKDANYKR